MYFDEPTVPFGEGDKLEGGMIAVAAVAVSPLGYLAIPLLSAWSINAAQALF